MTLTEARKVLTSPIYFFTLVSLATITVFSGAIYWSQFRIPVSEAMESKLFIGMSKNEVESVLGTPQGKWDDQWLYHCQGSSASFQVYFGPNSRLMEWGVDR